MPPILIQQKNQAGGYPRILTTDTRAENYVQWDNQTGHEVTLFFLDKETSDPDIYAPCGVSRITLAPGKSKPFTKLSNNSGQPKTCTYLAYVTSKGHEEEIPGQSPPKIIW